MAGCSTKQPLPAKEYFESANKNFRTGAYSAAVEDYRELLDQHPFSEHNEEAELRIAHAQYLQGSYAEAVVALSDFQRRHPTSPHLPFVGYILGMCYAQQLSQPDRDQTAAQNAQTYFLTLSRQYPESPFAELARQQLARCRDILAQHELYVAKFYERAGNGKATEVRLLTLAAQFGETTTAAQGLLQLAEHYQRRGETDHAALAYQAVTHLHPGTAFAVTAQQALQNLQKTGPLLGADPIDTLLAANGRQRAPTAFETVQLPGLTAPQMPRRSGGPGPLMAPPSDPFGRGRSYY
jgi:outer membrane protein assembly factor BamD